MSVPDLTGDVARARRLVVRGQLPVSAQWIRISTDAFEAVAVQHEVDHTVGLLFGPGRRPRQAASTPALSVAWPLPS